MKGGLGVITPWVILGGEWINLSVTGNGDLPLATQRRVESIASDRSPCAVPLPHPSAWSVVSYFLRYFSSTSTEQISPDSAGPYTSFDPVGFAIFATIGSANRFAAGCDEPHIVLAEAPVACGHSLDHRTCRVARNQGGDHVTPGQLRCARMRKSSFRGGRGLRCAGGGGGDATYT